MIECIFLKRNHRDEVQDINLVVLQFRAEMPNGTIKQYIENYELDIVDYIRRYFFKFELSYHQTKKITHALYPVFEVLNRMITFITCCSLA